ncbi:MAG: Lipopolysaccharide export system permease protein LptG [Pseudomonadota bacterium]
MKTIRRLLHREVLRTVAFVLLSFLALFTFFDLVEELQALNRLAAMGYQLQHALLYVSLKSPTHVYELMPISVLIGSIFVMARFAQSSEFTILRTGGLGPWRALLVLFEIGLVFVSLTFVLGDYVAPFTDKQAQFLKARFLGTISVGQTGAWLKEKQAERQFAINVRAMDGTQTLRDIRINEFNAQGRLLSVTRAESAAISDGAWELQNVSSQRLQDTYLGVANLQPVTMPALHWPTAISSAMVASALLRPDRMPALDLYTYMRHLKVNNQNAQIYEIEFWRKVFYPISCLVMLSLALPFAYLHFRSGQIAGHVFAGVLAGISFALLNNLFGHMGTLQQWTPWLTAAAPASMYSLVSLGAFWWLVLRR